MIGLDPARRAEAIDAGWAAYRERTPGMEEAYRLACEGWDVIAVVNDQEVIGALFAKDGVIHLGIVPAWRSRWASRRVIREMLAYGTTTTVMLGEPCVDFVKRIGFERDSDEFCRRYRWRPDRR